jgi:hypothetical protein
MPSIITPACRHRTLERLLARADCFLRQGRATSDRFSRWRLIIFLTGAFCTVGAYQLRWYHTGNASLAAFLLTFIVVARYHNRLENRMHRLREWIAIKRRHLARLSLDWEHLPTRSPALPGGHPFAYDLDLDGPASLLRLIDTTVSRNGRDRLMKWFFEQPPDPDKWLVRHDLIRALTPRQAFRDRLALEAAMTGRDEINGDRLQAVLQIEIGFPGLGTLLIAESVLALSTASLGLGALFLGLPGYWMVSFALYALLYLMGNAQAAESFNRALTIQGELDKLEAVFRFLERRPHATVPSLRLVLAPLTAGPDRPSRQIRRIRRICAALSVRAHPLIHLGLNAIGPWDVWWMDRFERRRRALIAQLPLWTDALAELDAAGTLATLAFLNPDYTWPVPYPDRHNGSAARLTAMNLGHPLLPRAQRVANDVTIEGRGRIQLITGSNMSGKSTFLRTVGVNVCLAQAGGPVCATSFQWTWVRPFACIRAEDSLNAGLSLFYAEVKRLKRLLDGSREVTPAPVLFLIDEIFKGTNNRERLLGGKAYIRSLAAGVGFGYVTTHDLELTELAHEIPTLTNAHFRETVEDRFLAFDYKLRPGPCPTTNALKIMAMEGLPVPDQSRPDPRG